MQVTGSSSLNAPQRSDIGPDLAGARADQVQKAAVRPVVGVRDADTQRSEGPPSQFWRTLNGGPDPLTHIAPPSIMQIKISQMLHSQVVSTEEPSPEEDGADPTKPVEATANRRAHRTEDAAIPTPGALTEPDMVASPAGDVRSAYADSRSMMQEPAQEIVA